MVARCHSKSQNTYMYKYESKDFTQCDSKDPEIRTSEADIYMYTRNNAVPSENPASNTYISSLIIDCSNSLCEKHRDFTFQFNDFICEL